VLPLTVPERTPRRSIRSAWRAEPSPPNRLMPPSSNRLETPSPTRPKRVTIGATLLEHLLPEGERAQECADEDLETADAVAGNVTSYKSFARGPKKFGQLCVRRAAFWSGKDFRIMDREAPFGQSRGHWAINSVMSKKVDTDSDGTMHVTSSRKEMGKLWAMDFYHTFLDAKLRIQLLIFLFIYLVSFSIFAVFFMMVEEPCGLKIQSSFLRAYMLSVETMMTVGYGVSDPYMQGCWQGAVIITTQSLLQMLVSACLIGVIFQGISRPQSRANTILFSEKAVIRCIDGAHYLMFRIADLRIQHALIEPHVRCICVHMNQGRESRFEMTPLRLQQPDDELGASLVPSLPNVVVHRIDAWSPLAPRSHVEQRSVSSGRHSRTSDSRASARLSRCFSRTGSIASTLSAGAVSQKADSEVSEPEAATTRQVNPMRMASWPGPFQRQVNCETGNRGSCFCPTCGEAFGTAELLKLHCKYLAVNDKASGLPPDSCHWELAEDDLTTVAHMEPTRDEIQEHLAQGFFEVVVLVEGVEPTTSATLQARHSYTLGGAEGGDIVWDMDFAECCRLRADGSKGLVVDYGRFHQLEPEV